MSGGSAGNTMACFASLGGKGAYIGRVADDQFGRVFTHDMNAIGIYFNTPPLPNSKPTAQCLILVTPDASRTMNTYLGASTQLFLDDVNEDLIAQSEVTYLEGYLFDEAPAKAAFFKAAELVKKHGRKLSLTLSDPFCVVRHREDFKKLLPSVDILFANEYEILELTETKNIDDAIQSVRGLCNIIAITMGEKGSRIVCAHDTYNVKAVPPSKLVDTTGAGDAYAAGFLFGLTQEKPLEICGHYGSLSASEVICHMGPRPQISLKTLI